MEHQSHTLPESYRYWAFLSYSHADNQEPGRKWADWLHDAFETYRMPEDLVGTDSRNGIKVPERFYPVFQDEKELPTQANLGNALETALRESLYLVVLCSPRSAASLWVNEEILLFKKLGREDRILPIIIDGEPNASEPGKEHFPAASECFPESLRYQIGADGNLDKSRRTEPIAADIRMDDGTQPSLYTIECMPLLEREKLRLIAGIAGLGFDQLIQRDRQREVLRALRAKQEKEREAAELLKNADDALETLKREAPRHGPEFLFAQLGAAEDFLLRAGERNPELVSVPERLREVRAALVESGIRSGDLNMATLYLTRLRQTDNDVGKDMHNALQASLDEAIRSSDPAYHPLLAKAGNTVFASLLLGLIWMLVLPIAFLFLISEEKSLNANINPLWLLCPSVAGIPSILCLRHIERARGGNESNHRKAILSAYMGCFASLFTLNPILLLGLAHTLYLLTTTKTMRLAWRNPIPTKTM